MRLSAKEAQALGLHAERPKKKRRLTPAEREAKRLLQERQRLARKAREDAFDRACEAHGLPLPDHEYPWAKEAGRNFRADHVFEGWLIVEEDGGIFGCGPKCPACGRRPSASHGSIEKMLSDRKRDQLAARLGFVTVRFLPEDFEFPPTSPKRGTGFLTIKEILGKEHDQP